MVGLFCIELASPMLRSASERKLRDNDARIEKEVGHLATGTPRVMWRLQPCVLVRTITRLVLNDEHEV